MKRYVLVAVNLVLFVVIFQSERIVQCLEKNLKAKYQLKSMQTARELRSVLPVVKVVAPAPVAAPAPAPAPVAKVVAPAPVVTSKWTMFVSRLASLANLRPRASMPISGNMAMPPPPKFVQTLTAEQFRAWATWQNMQVKLNQGEGGDRYVYGSRSVTDTSDRSSFLYGGRFDSRGNDVRSGGMDTRGQSVTSNYPLRFSNTDYASPGQEMVYNPFVRSTGGTGLPDWDNLYVPVGRGSMTVSEALRKCGPMEPEQLFEKLMSPYFKR